MTIEEQIHRRSAIEALRAGVPNRDAVRELGCAQPGIEQVFRQLLGEIGGALAQGLQAPGLLITGDFGSGKSHLLEYLQHVALQERFVVSKVVVSKETPLHDPAKLYRSAVEAAKVHGKRGAALTEIATSLDFKRPEYVEFYKWVNSPDSQLNSRFPATLFLYERMGSVPELRDRMISFWSGTPIGVGEIKRALRQCGELVTYKMEKITLRELALQRFKFTPRLMIAAGYAGWVLLVDEVELVGRYSLRQRAKSYAELARWVGKLEGEAYPGLGAVFSITKDFEEEVLNARNDLERVPGRLRASAVPADHLLASGADRGMRLIQRDRLSLEAPSRLLIEETYGRLRDLHGQAYGWEPPSVPVEGLTSTLMRQYVRRWINEWDLKRLYPDYKAETEVTELTQDYTEDRDLETPTEAESEADNFGQDTV